MEVDPLYIIEEHRYTPKFRTRTYTLRLRRQIINPVIDFMRIIQELADKHNYRDNTCVTFGGQDTNGKQFYVNRVDRRPVFIDTIRDYDAFSKIIYEVCALILNSGQSLEFNEGATIKATFTEVPFEYMVQIATNNPK